MDMETRDGHIDIRALLKEGTPLSEFRLGLTAFRLADGGPDDDGSGKNLPINRDDAWQDMLRMVLGRVPEDAEHAPPCYCELVPVFEKCDFAGLAGLPPAVRLMDGFFPVRNQGKRGACFTFALVALCEYMLGKKVKLSEQSLFHFTKLVTPGKVEQITDGAFTLDAIHAVEEYGICPLSEWHYNPESWNYVEDPYNEGQGMALQRKLASAQKYRFRHWRTLSSGSVFQFKQALSAKFPVYTGVLVTTDWDDEDVRRTGMIPVPKLLWRIRIMPPPRGLVEEIMSEDGIDPQSDGAEAVAMQIAGKLIQETIDYLSSAVFGCEFFVHSVNEKDDGVEFVALLNKFCGGHAFCLAGYADDPAYEGGGYFIARNSWSNTEWAPESPEMPGYALIPYAYIADLGHEGVVMSEFPQHETSCMASAAAAPVQLGNGFDAWLAEHSVVLDRPVRDKNGILLRAGTKVLIPDSSKPSEVLCDTQQNRAKLRPIYDSLAKNASWEALVNAVRKIADEAFGRHSWVLSLDDIRESLAEIGVCPENAEELRAALLAVQKTDQNTYALCINQFGREELRHASVLGSRKRVTE